MPKFVLYHIDESVKGSLAAHMAALKSWDTRGRKQNFWTEFVETSEPYNPGTNPVRLGTLFDGTKVIEKETSFEEAAQEQFAYELNKALGFNVVPYTEASGEISRQEFIPDTHSFHDSPAGYLDFALDTKKGKYDTVSVEEMGVLDNAMQNFDRHKGNILVDKNRHVWAIDNGKSGALHTSPAVEYISKNGLSEGTKEKIRKFLASPTRAQWKAKYGKYYSPNKYDKDNINELFKRLEKMAL